MKNQVVLITGASSGIGYVTALELLNQGYTVYGAARRIDKMQALIDKGMQVIELDLTSDISMTNCVNRIVQKEGHIDILINNAGYGSFGSVEDVPIEEARRQFEVNLFGLARMIQLVLPSMREQKSGKIINIGSMAGKIWTSFGAWYHATKFALEGFSDCLRLELEPFGIDVILIEPGGIKTEWGEIAADHLRKSAEGGAYFSQANKSADTMIEFYQHPLLSKPELIAKTISKAIHAKRPQTRYLVGFMAKPLVFLKNICSDRVFDWIIKTFH